MNKQLKKYIIPIIITASLLVAFIILYKTIPPLWEDFSQKKRQFTQAQTENTALGEAKKQREEKEKREAIKLKSIKPIFTTELEPSGENLSAFGNMFEDITNLVRSSGLLIRSIEYDLKPVNDEIYKKFSDEYNVCELKFFMVGKYDQLLKFLQDMNTSFKYLTLLSHLEVSAFSENKNYILIEMSITMYSQKEDK